MIAIKSIPVRVATIASGSYAVWTVVWWLIAQFAGGEAAISAAIVLTVTGLPSTLMAVPGNAQSSQLVVAGLLGLVQWGTLAYWIAHMRSNRPK